ncbi:MAG: Zn-dependent alcohol dehydrogenase [Actinomycetota bacterium]
MRAAVLREAGAPLTIEEVDIDDPGPGEVRIRTAAAGVCHSDLHFIEGLHHTPMPCVPGHESAGVVEAVGPDVTYVAPGDHVITCMSAFCGVCRNCTAGRPVLCESDETWRASSAPPRLSQNGEPFVQLYNLGSYAEQMLVHERSCVKVRDDMPLDRGALIGCAVMTGFGAVTNTAQVPVGSTVAVIGCGGIGLSAVNGAAIAGAGRIIAVDVSPAKLETARTFGATDMVDASTTDPVRAVRELTGGGVDYAFEAVGRKATSEQAYEMIRFGGTAVVVGMVPQGQKLEIDAEALLMEKTLTGSNMGSNRFREDMPQLVEFFLAGRLHLDAMVTERVGLDDINEAFAAMASGEVARSVIVFD